MNGRKILISKSYIMLKSDNLDSSLMEILWIAEGCNRRGGGNEGWNIKSD